MNEEDPRKLSDEDIVRLAKTLNQPVPERLEKSLWEQIEALDRSKASEPDEDPEPELDEEPERDEDLEP